MSGPTFTHALVRQVSRSLAECSLTHLPRSPIDLSLASRQHAAYVATLRALDIDVTVLPEEPDLADGVTMSYSITGARMQQHQMAS